MNGETWIVRGGFHSPSYFTDEQEARKRFESDAADEWSSGTVTLSVERRVEQRETGR